MMSMIFNKIGMMFIWLLMFVLVGAGLYLGSEAYRLESLGYTLVTGLAFYIANAIRLAIKY